METNRKPKRICKLPGAGFPGSECGAKDCPVMRDGTCGLPKHILLALQARESVPYLEPDPDDSAELENRTGKALQSCGMSPALAGYRHLQRAVCIGIQDPDKLAKVWSRLMPAVAEECGKSVAGVDRNIRTAVESIFEEPNEYLLRLFPSVQDGRQSIVPNKWFISTLAEAVRRGVVA